MPRCEYNINDTTRNINETYISEIEGTEGLLCVRQWQLGERERERKRTDTIHTTVFSLAVIEMKLEHGHVYNLQKSKVDKEGEFDRLVWDRDIHEYKSRHGPREVSVRDSSFSLCVPHTLCVLVPSAASVLDCV